MYIQIVKAINNCYRGYNINQYPFVCLNIIVNRRNVDVNLTPDKRSVLINKENLLALLIQRSMVITYGKIPSTYKLQNDISNLSQQKLDFAGELNTKTIDIVPLSTKDNFREVLSQWKRTDNINGSDSNQVLTSCKRKYIEDIDVQIAKMQKFHASINHSSSSFSHEKSGDMKISTNQDTEDTNIHDPKNLVNNNRESPKRIINVEIKRFAEDTLKLSDATKESEEDCPTKKTANELKDFIKSNSPIKAIEFDGNGEQDAPYPNIICNEINVVLSEIELNMKTENNYAQIQKDAAKIECLRFKSTIVPGQNKSAEQELEKEITKESFSRMKVLGQFNRGFIIVKLESDLFIVDQHATDEKYNFEMLQRTVQLQYQPLTVAQPLNLTVMSELTLLDNLEIFERNGFRFAVNEIGKLSSYVDQIR